MKNRNEDINNQQPSQTGNRRFNRLLLIINVILFICSLVTSFLYLHYEDYELSVCMLLVALFTAANSFSIWKRMHGAHKEK